MTRYIVAHVPTNRALLADDCATRHEAEYWREQLIEVARQRTGRDMSDDFFVRETTDEDRRQFGTGAGIMVGPPDPRFRGD